MATQKSNQSVVFLVILSAVLLALLVYFTRRPPEVKITGDEISKTLEQFAEASYMAPSGPIANIQCNAAGECTKGLNEIPDGPSGWFNVLYSNIYLRTKDPVYLKKLQEMVLTFEKFNSTGSMNAWTLKKAFDATQDYQILLKFVGMMFTETNGWENVEIDSKRISGNAFMYTAMHLIQLLELRSILTNQEQLKKLTELNSVLMTKLILPDKWVPIMDGMIDTMLTALEKLDVAEKREDASVQKLIPGKPFSSETCWVAMAHWNDFKLRGTKRSKDYVDNFFSEVDFLSPKVRFEVLQNVLPCLTVMKDFKNSTRITSEYHQLMESVVLSNFDARKRPICDGDNGLLGATDAATGDWDKCTNNIKSLADIVWTAELLSGDKDIYTLR